MKIFDNAVIKLIKQFNGKKLNISKICKEANITYSYGNNIISYLKELNLIEISGEGTNREKIYRLKDKGKRIKYLILEIEELVL